MRLLLSLSLSLCHVYKYIVLKRDFLQFSLQAFSTRNCWMYVMLCLGMCVSFFFLCNRNNNSPKTTSSSMPFSSFLSFSLSICKSKPRRKNMHDMAMRWPSSSFPPTPMLFAFTLFFLILLCLFQSCCCAMQTKL